MTPQEWWRAVKDAGFDATTTKVLYALSLEPFDSNGTMCRPPVTYASFARKAGVKKGRAAWSKLEDVLAERRLKRELSDFEDGEL
jgi:hypothetical protein